MSRSITFRSVRTRDPSNGELLRPDEIGELEFAGPSRMLGYLDDPAATARAVTADGYVRSEMCIESISVCTRVRWPAGEGYVWVAGEAPAVRAVRAHLVNERGVDRKRIRASAYWRRGQQAVHETVGD